MGDKTKRCLKNMSKKVHKFVPIGQDQKSSCLWTQVCNMKAATIPCACAPTPTKCEQKSTGNKTMEGNSENTSI